MRIRTLAGALAMSGLVVASLPSDAEAARRRSGSGDRGYSSRSQRPSGSYRSSRSYRSSHSYRSSDSYRSSHSYRSSDSYRSSHSYRSSRSYGYRDRGYNSSRSYRSYDRYRSYGSRASYYRPYHYAYDPYYYGYAFAPYPYPYPYEPYGYSRAHYHGRLSCVLPHLSVHIGF